MIFARAFSGRRASLFIGGLAIFFAMSVEASARDRFQLQFQPSSEQAVQWQDGIQFIENVAASSVIRVYNLADELPDEQSTFRVYVLNMGEGPIVVSPTDIWIEFGDADRVDMVTYEELEGGLRRDIERRRVLAVIGGAFSAQGANGYSSGSVHYQGTTSNGTSFSGNGTYSNYDPNLAQKQQQAASAQSADVMQSIRVRGLQGMDALGGLLRANTVMPGQVVGGTLAYNLTSALRRLRDASSITLVIRIGSDEHRIAATISELD